MNAHDGHVYDLGPEFTEKTQVGESLSVDGFVATLEKLEREATPDEQAAARDLVEGAAIVRVDAAAAQRARLGDRELRRRRQRRR